MKHFALTLLMLLAVNVCHAQDPNFYIYLAIGQSNMVGQGPIEHQDSIVDDRFLNMTASDCDIHETGKWRKAIPPLARQYTKIGPTDYFGRTMVQHLPKDVRVGTIIVAVDGCSIRLFHPDSCAKWTAGNLPDWQRNEVNCYGGEPLKRLITLAKQAQNDGVIKGILLHQGETDAYNDTWLRMVKELYDNLLNELNLKAEECPLIAGETVDSTYNGVCAHALPTIRQLPEWINNSYVVSSKGCSPLSDNVHFSTEGYRKIGKRYAYAALDALGIKVKDDTLDDNNDAVEQFGVDVKMNKKGTRATITSEKPIVKVSVVSYSGKKVAEFVTMGISDNKIMVNLKGLEKERVLIFVVTAIDGTESSKQIER